MRPLPSAAGNALTRGQHHDHSDTLSQGPSLAPLDCFLTTESNLSADDSRQGHLETMSSIQGHAQKHNMPNILTSECARSVPQFDPAESSVESSNAVKDDSRPSTPLFPSNYNPGSVNSIPSSPGCLSSVTVSDDPHSLSASLSELPPSHSQIEGIPPGFSRSLTPQLVMPSLTVPQRRPFSEVGRSLGKLKLLVTGPGGIGKSSLIPAIAQSSAHIVHMDSINEASDNVARDIYASTRPKPWWRTDLFQDFSRRRRSSIPDEVLDRNVCFVDCPVYRHDNQGPSPAIQYVESRLAHLFNKSMNDPDLCALLGGGAEPNVDAVLYLLPHTGPTCDDLACMRGLQDATNVIPLLARADELSVEEQVSGKRKIMQDIETAGLDCFFFTVPEDTQDHPPIKAVSSATRADYETIDASILMSSNYLPPLVSTDLEDFVKMILSVEGSTWLRHTAACKAIKWLRQQRLQGRLSHSALSCRQFLPGLGLARGPRPNEFLDRQHWGRVEMSSWAEELRQSLATERLSLSWQQMAQSRSVSQRQLVLKGRRRSCSKSLGATVATPVTMNHQDPLGLLQLVGQLQSGGKLALELISSLGVLGCVAAWVVRPELIHQWDMKFSPCLL